MLHGLSIDKYIPGKSFLNSKCLVVKFQNIILREGQRPQRLRSPERVCDLSDIQVMWASPGQRCVTARGSHTTEGAQDLIFSLYIQSVQGGQRPHSRVLIHFKRIRSKPLSCLLPNSRTVFNRNLFTQSK